MPKLLCISALALSACFIGADTPCEQAEDYVADCTGDVPAGFADSCDDQTAEAVLALDCEALASDAKGGKSDGRFGWKDRGDSCTFNFQCSDELVCRPTGESSGTLGVSDEFCLDRGTFGDYCDSDADCDGDLKCIGDAILGGDNGFCRKPIG
jgi:hypothetical protein